MAIVIVGDDGDAMDGTLERYDRPSPTYYPPTFIALFAEYQPVRNIGDRTYKMNDKSFLSVVPGPVLPYS